MSLLNRRTDGQTALLRLTPQYKGYRYSKVRIRVLQVNKAKGNCWTFSFPLGFSYSCKSIHYFFSFLPRFPSAEQALNYKSETFATHFMQRTSCLSGTEFDVNLFYAQSKKTRSLPCFLFLPMTMQTAFLFYWPSSDHTNYFIWDKPTRSRYSCRCRVSRWGQTHGNAAIDCWRPSTQLNKTFLWSLLHNTFPGGTYLVWACRAESDRGRTSDKDFYFFHRQTN